MKIEDIISQLNKDIDFAGIASSLAKLEKPEIISTGLMTLDKITGIGGIPRGLITEIFGNPSSGKTSLCLKLISEAQKENIQCAYIDLELALNQELASKLGVDLNKLLIVRASSGEESFEVIESLSEKGFGLIVLDSVASLSAIAELESDYDEQTIGLQARLISKGLRKIIGCIMRNKTALVFINQIRAKMAKMPGAKTTTTSGGMAIPFYSTLRLETTRIEWLKSNNEIEGMTIRIKTEKNKLYRPQLQTDVQFLFDSGFNVPIDKLQYLLNDNTISLIGRTYYKNNEKLGDKEKVLQMIKDNQL